MPPTYRPESTRIDVLPFGRTLRIWLHSLRKNRLRQLQRMLIDMHFPHPRRVSVEEATTPIDRENHLNEVVFRVHNSDEYPTRHIVFVHGYGASLGCFARNFHLVEDLRHSNSNYVVYFLDNVSFGLSSNPKLPSVAARGYWLRIPKMDFLRLGPGADRPVWHNRYYQLLEYFEVDVDKRRHHAQEVGPILQDMEEYYVGALEKWRASRKIKHIDYLVGHSFGGYWAGCYAIKHAHVLRNLVLLSPVGVERHAGAITDPAIVHAPGAGPSPQSGGTQSSLRMVPLLDPTSYRFLGKLPNLSAKTVDFWYNVQPYLPRLLKWMGPWGVQKYYQMWYSKLFAINKVVAQLGGAQKVMTSGKQLVFGTNAEVHLLIEYLYNSITSGTHSDIHVKYLLTPATTSRWPLYDKFMAAKQLPKCHFVYGQYDFMCGEAGEKLAQALCERGATACYHEVPQGGHNLYIQNPFGTNKLLLEIFAGEREGGDVKEREDMGRSTKERVLH